MKKLQLLSTPNKRKPATILRQSGPAKYFLILVTLTISALHSFAQVGISNSSITPDASSILELRSSSAGFLPPRMTTAQRNAIASVATGLLIYNTDTNQLNYYNGSIWQIVSGGSAVTSVSVTTANGVSGTVINPTTTPAISLTLGGITPSSVAATGTVTGSNLSGTNTGDQTLASLGAQPQLNGTGFVKATGTTISYDNSTYLTSIDTTNIANFSGKVRSRFSSTSPITYSNGLIGITQATTSTNGYLSSADWNTFNNKQPAGSYLTANQNITLSGDATGSGTTAITTTVGKINGTSLASLATGILKNTTGTGKPSIAIASDFPTLNQNTTGSAANWTTARTIAITGDLTYTSPAFNGTANVTAAGTLATVNANVGSFTNANITVNAKGLITAATNGNSGTVTNIATGYGLSGGPITSTGTIVVDTATLHLKFLALKDSINAITGYTTLYQNSLKQNQLNGTGIVKATGTTISYVPVLPISNGGTNSSTALNNNRVMVSSGGSIVEAPALTNGQLLVGSTGAAPVATNLTAGNGIAITNSAGGITIANQPSINQVSATNDITTTSTSDVVVTGMTVTPGAGDYLVFFTGSLENTNANKQGTVSIYSNGVQIAASEIQSQMPANRPVPISTNAYITGLGAGQAIDIRWNVVGNTGTFHQRTLIVQRVK